MKDKIAVRYRYTEGQLPVYSYTYIPPDDPDDPCRECDGFMDEECYNCDKAASFWANKEALCASYLS